MLNLTVPFEEHLHDAFLQRIEKINNHGARKFIEERKDQVFLQGLLCKTCNEVKPLYFIVNQNNSKMECCLKNVPGVYIYHVVQVVKILHK